MDKEKLPVHKEEKNKNKGFRAVSYTMAAILIIFALIMAVNLVQNMQLKKAYNNAKDLCFQGKYQEAIEGFEAMGELNYQDAGAFVSYCRGRICYAQGRIDDAETDMIFASFRYLEPQEQQIIEDFEKELSSAAAAFEAGDYKMEFYPDAEEFFFYHGEDFQSFEECERYYFINQASK